MVNILIVEDDEMQRKNLIKMIKGIKDEITIFEAEGEKDAIEMATRNEINFFYIDVALKNSSGIALALKLREVSRYSFSFIIFITTHKRYMLTAFKNVHCYDYIIKPYDKEEVKNITKRLIDNINKNSNEDREKKKYVVFENNKINIKIYLDDIFFVEVNLRNLMVHTKNGRFDFSRLSLKKVIEMVCDDYILQTHKSFVINMKNVYKIEKYSNNVWKASFLNYEEVAYISSKYKENVDKYLF